MFEGITTTKAAAGLAVWWLTWLGIETYLVNFYGISLPMAFLDAGMNVALLVITSFGLFNIIRFYRPTRGNLLYLRIWALIHSWFLTALQAWIIAQLVSSDSPLVPFISLSWPIRYVFNLMLVSVTSVVTIMFYYLRDEKDKEKRKDDAEKLAKETELVKLRQQLQPHFLFNSLNSISALAGNKPEEARKMIQQLSDFLRGTLRKDEQQLVSLKEELTHLHLYLDIEKVRFGHRLNTHIDFIEDLQALLVPSLLLQPVVENAIKFGLYDTTEQVLIEVTTTLVNKELIIQVKNPYDPETARPRKGTGFGLSSISRRLYLLYGRKDLMETKAEASHFITTLYIPQS
jgi:sensor histidine kinase YesM